MAIGFFLRSTLVSLFAGQFLPAGVGMDAARVAPLWRQNVPLSRAVHSVVIDRTAGLAGVFVVMAMGLPFVIGFLPSSIVTTAATTSALLLAAAATALASDKLPLATRLRSGKAGILLRIARDTRAVLITKLALRALVYAIGIQLLGVATILLIARAFGYSLQFSELMTVSAFAIFAALLPISVNGWGVREGAMVLGLSVFGVGKEAAFLISFPYGIVLAVVALPGAFSWYRMSPLD